MVSGENTIAYSSESSYAANLEMATNGTNQSNRVVAEEKVTRVAHQMLNQSMNLQPSKRSRKEQIIKTLFYMADVGLLQPF